MQPVHDKKARKIDYLDNVIPDNVAVFKFLVKIGLVSLLLIHELFVFQQINYIETALHFFHYRS